MFDLGEGTYATVYLGESLLTGKPVALKVSLEIPNRIEQLISSGNKIRT